MTDQDSTRLTNFKEIASLLISEADARLVVLMGCIFAGMFYPSVLYAVWIYFILFSIVNIGRMLRTAWEYPTNPQKPLRMDASIGFPMLFFVLGFLGWLYWYTPESMESVTTIDFIIAFSVMVLISAVVGSLLTVGGIEVVRNIRIKLYGSEEEPSD